MQNLQSFLKLGASRRQYNAIRQIILLNTPIQEYTPDERPDYETVAPLGLGYIGTISKQMGYNVHLIDAEARKLSVEEIVEEVNQHQPSIIALNIVATNIGLARKILSQVHITPSTLVMAGGAHPTLLPEVVFKTIPEIQIIVRGEGELVWAKILCNFPNLRLHEVKGISFRMGDSIVHNPDEQLIEDLDEIPFIDRTLFTNDPYKKGGSAEAAVISSRGCNYNCVFCSVPSLCRRRVRFRSVNNVVDEIELLHRMYGVTSIRFMDDNFTHKLDRVRELSSEFIKRGINIKWRALSRLENIDEETLSLMKQAGCYLLSFGIESANRDVQRLIRKIVDLDKLKKTLQICKKIGIKTKGFFTIGYPDETDDQINQTIDFAVNSGFDDICISIVRVFPATSLSDILMARGWNEEETLSYHQFKSVLKKDELNEQEKMMYDSLSKQGFKFDKFVKYHVANTRSMCKLSLDELDNKIKQAYKEFYLDKREAAANGA
ncbi:MAG: B12-binding domain-containing radical SAM protein [Nanoarchaeota archaeon]|nr:B12-binding domain-containing radical SAM protein [Nanoarchaeota archaeon]